MTPSLDTTDSSVLFRCHSLASIMAEPRNKSDTISQGAKTAVNRMLREIVFGLRGEINSRPLKKGLQCENDSIALLAHVLGRPLAKNTERRTNDWLSGEPDIIEAESGIDIKTSWSVDSFPMTEDDAHDSTYEWQCRGYMMLFDKPRWSVAYCLVDTPDDLIGYEDPKVHKVSHLPPLLRVTRITYERDAALEDKIKAKAEAARAYLIDALRKIELRTELYPHLLTKLSWEGLTSAQKEFAPVEGR